MTETWAKRILMTMQVISVLGAIEYTFIDQSILMTLVCISSFFTFRFALKNPKLVMATSWEEFGELADNAVGKADVFGTPLYFVWVFFAVLYIILI